MVSEMESHSLSRDSLGVAVAALTLSTDLPRRAFHACLWDGGRQAELLMPHVN